MWSERYGFCPMGDKIPDLYFEVSVFLITFVLMGKWLELRAKGKTGDAIQKLMGLQAKTARVIRDGQTSDIRLKRSWPVISCIIRPEKIPVDGVVTKGLSSADGPCSRGKYLVEKKEGDPVIDLQSTKRKLRVPATRRLETALAQIIRLIEDAQGRRRSGTCRPCFRGSARGDGHRGADIRDLVLPARRASLLRCSPRVRDRDRLSLRPRSRDPDCGHGRWGSAPNTAL